MFRANSEARPVEMFPGVTRRTLTSGDNMTLAEITLSSGAVVPIHTHHHEQAGYVARGHVRFSIGGQEQELAAGDGYCVPGGEPHGVQALEDSICIDIFSPAREEYVD